MAVLPAKVPALSPANFYEANYKRNVWRITVPEFNHYDNLLDPGYLSHVASRLRPFDIVEAEHETGEWYAEFIVLDCGATWAKLEPKGIKVELQQKIPVGSFIPDGYEITWKGPRWRWCAVRKNDSLRVIESQPSQNQCLLELHKFVAKRVA